MTINSCQDYSYSHGVLTGHAAFFGSFAYISQSVSLKQKPNQVIPLLKPLTASIRILTSAWKALWIWHQLPFWPHLLLLLLSLFCSSHICPFTVPHVCRYSCLRTSVHAVSLPEMLFSYYPCGWIAFSLALSSLCSCLPNKTFLTTFFKITMSFQLPYPKTYFSL